MLDSLQRDPVGVYGSDWIEIPNIDGTEGRLYENRKDPTQHEGIA
jgi:hypothetical protein